MGFLPAEPDSDPGGPAPNTDSPAPPLTASRDELFRPLPILADARDRLLAALDDPTLPAGTVANVLSAVARIAIAIAELPEPPAPPAPVLAADPAAGEWPTVATIITRAIVRLMELHQDCLAILAELDTDLSSFEHRIAVELRSVVRQARAQVDAQAARWPFQDPDREPPQASSPQPEE